MDEHNGRALAFLQLMRPVAQFNKTLMNDTDDKWGSSEKSEKTQETTAFGGKPHLHRRAVTRLNVRQTFNAAERQFCR